ncbi:hypothetical protein [Clostridium beijerinckii]|uniref:hypothetical protein n=1 Tax=Clostridium beijerinckii TaxID=1520 RepID=UPI000809AB90|nr:hypothetical protein [Clostridium beijerinckii]OCA96895.1 hypothetical protein BGS1_06480 [Clostridium beijerinckii]
MKSKIIKIIVLITIIIIVIISLLVYRFNSRKILYGYMNNVRISNVGAINYSIPKEKRGKISQNLNEYAYMYYGFVVSNTSEKFKAENINFEPQFADEMKDNVVWYDSTDDVYPGQSTLENKKVGECERIVLVKRNGYTDDELINMAKKDKFKMIYWSIEGDSILSMGKSKQIVEYEDN